MAASPVTSVVLVVEDEPMIRMGAMALVANIGLEYYEASSADEAIALLEVHPHITIVFTDIHMAGSMDGLQLSTYAHHRWPPLKFIIVSGNPHAAIEEMPDGALFIQKPYSDVAIGNAIRALA